MPHDGNGNVVRKGDRVMVCFEVENVTESEDYCNMLIKPVIPMPGENAYQGGFNLNTKQGILLWRANPQESETDPFKAVPLPQRAVPKGLDGDCG